MGQAACLADFPCRETGPWWMNISGWALTDIDRRVFLCVMSSYWRKVFP